jgi:hypothetical protein
MEADEEVTGHHGSHMRNSAKPGLIIFVSGILGLIMIGIQQLLYTNHYYLDRYITDPSQLPGLQILTIILFLLIGCILAAISQ